MSKHWKRTLSLLSVAAVVGLVSAGLALGKKPPREPDPPEVTVRYSITFLGTLDGDATSVTRDLNNFGEVVGYSRSADGVNRAFVWNNSDGMVALNELIAPNSGWDLREARGINNAGQICGRGYLNGETGRRPYRFTPGVGGEWPVVDDLGTFGGDNGWASAINDNGEVAGCSNYANGRDGAFVWTKQGGMVDIGDLGGYGALPYAINNYGQVTGKSFKDYSTDPKWSGPWSWSAFRYTPGVGDLPGVMEDLGDFGWADTKYFQNNCGWDINDDGNVVGLAGNIKKTKGWSDHHAFLYTDQMIDLGTLGGYFSEARGVNSSNHVVGVSSEILDDSTRHGFLYTDNTDTGESVMVKLQDPDLIPNLPDGFQGPISPEKINDAGQICGTADGEAFLLTP